MTSLRPDESIHKFLISTPSRFVGEFESDDLLITHAWSGLFSRSDLHALGYRAGPYSRNYYVIVVRIPPPERQPDRVHVSRNLRPLGEHFCAGLSFLFW